MEGRGALFEGVTAFDVVEECDDFLGRFGSESVGAGNPELPKAEAAVEVFGSCLSLSGGKGRAVTR